MRVKRASAKTLREKSRQRYRQKLQRIQNQEQVQPEKDITICTTNCFLNERHNKCLQHCDTEYNEQLHKNCVPNVQQQQLLQGSSVDEECNSQRTVHHPLNDAQEQIRYW